MISFLMNYYCAMAAALLASLLSVCFTKGLNLFMSIFASICILAKLMLDAAVGIKLVYDLVSTVVLGLMAEVTVPPKKDSWKDMFELTPQNLFMLAPYVCFLLYAVYWLFRAIIPGKIIVIKQDRTYAKTDLFIPERMQPGSQFELNAKLPQFQCEVFGAVGGTKFYPLGQAFWVDQGLITAAHVVYDVDSIMLVREGIELIVGKDDFVFLDGDIALYNISQSETAKLGLCKAKLSQDAVIGKSGLMASVVAFGQRSTGFLGEYEQFGYCTYGGSTLKGFSGAPYYLNKTVFGMHLGGNISNLGYESAYIRSILKPSKTIVGSQESSDEWLIEQAQRSMKFEYQRSPYDPDEYRVKMNGRYHMVDEVVLSEMLANSRGVSNSNGIDYELEAHSVEGVDDLPLCPRGAMDFQDQGNLIRAPAVIAGAHGVEQVPANARPQGKPTLFQTASKYQKPSGISHMESRKLMHAPQSGVSESTVLNRNRKRKLRNRHQKNAMEQLCKRVAHMENGPQILQELGIEQNGLIPNSQQLSVS